jgi:ATP-binding cassette subfamily B protein/ATP-binding cassette subfamily C protein
LNVKIPLKQYWHLLIDYLRPQWPWVVGLAALILSNIGLQLVNPQIVRRFIDTAQEGGEPNALFRAALLFVGVALVQQVASVLATYVGENVGWTATNALRTDVANHCLRLDMSFHNARTPGEMIERVDGDVNALSAFFSQFAIQVFGNALLLVGVLILLFREDWRVGAVFAAFATLALSAMLRLRDIAVPHWKAEREASAEQFGYLEERLAGSEDIRSCGAKPYVMRRFYALMRDLMKKTLKAGMMVNIMVNATSVLFALGNAAAFALGAYLYLSDAVTIGTAFIISWYSHMLMHPIQRITWQMQELQRAGAGIARVRELLDVESKIEEIGEFGNLGLGDWGDSPVGEGALAVEFRDVTFGYDDAEGKSGKWANEGNGQAEGRTEDEDGEQEKEMVLHDISFRLRRGAVLGLLGRTGSGKTTLTRLIFRLYDPDSGAVCLGNDGTPVDVRHVPLQQLRQRVGMVTQNIQLFHATVRDNLTFFDRSIPDETIRRVIYDLELGEWFDALPEGLDTDLESGGGGLSAGEAQLLAFTRIFLQDPGLVILDEASSRLDPATEHRIERAVDRLVQDRTAIIIAHRLRTVQHADEIMILEDGHICEHDDRATLAGDPTSRFYGLLRTGLEEVLA